MFHRMLQLMRETYGDAYSEAYLKETITLYLDGVRDWRLPDIAITLIDKFGYMAPADDEPDSGYPGEAFGPMGQPGGTYRKG